MARLNKTWLFYSRLFWSLLPWMEILAKWPGHSWQLFWTQSYFIFWEGQVHQTSASHFITRPSILCWQSGFDKSKNRITSRGPDCTRPLCSPKQTEQCLVCTSSCSDCCYFSQNKWFSQSDSALHGSYKNWKFDTKIMIFLWREKPQRFCTLLLRPMHAPRMWSCRCWREGSLRISEL